MDLFELIILVISFFSLLALGVPISFCMGISTVLTMLFSIDLIPAMSTVTQRIATGLDSFALLAIPLFILGGQFMNHGGLARRLIDLAKLLVGRLPGGLAIVNVLSSMFFGAISGSAVAAASAIGGTLGPIMEEEGFDKDFSAAVNIVSSTTGLIIPPSNILIIYSLASGGVSIASLFLAGYLPGMLVGVLLMMVIAFYAHYQRYPFGKRGSVKDAVAIFFRALPSLFLIVIVIGGIVGGVFTATEASAIMVFYAFILSVIIYREIPLKKIPQILLESASTTSIVMFLIGTSMGMSWIMAYANIPQNITHGLLTYFHNPVLILLIINLILLVVGTFMDMTPAVLIFTPIFLPVVVQLGIDPVHFGIIMVLNLSIGICTPPVGSVLFVGCSIANTSINKVIKPLMPLFITMIIALMIITYVPGISLWIPRLFGF